MSAKNWPEDVLFVYVTTPSVELASSIAREAVEDGLAACANILPGMKSIYRWEGRVEEAAEAVLILKTTRAAFEALAQRVRTLHPYECPCIAGLPLGAGTADYLDWIRRSVRPTEEPSS